MPILAVLKIFGGNCQNGHEWAWLKMGINGQIGKKLSRTAKNNFFRIKKSKQWQVEYLNLPFSMKCPTDKNKVDKPPHSSGDSIPR